MFVGAASSTPREAYGMRPYFYYVCYNVFLDLKGFIYALP